MAGGAPSDNLYITNLPAGLQDSQLRAVFTQYGTVTNVNILQRNPGEKVHAMVRMSGSDEAAWIIQNLDGNIPQGLSEAVGVKFANAPFEGGLFGAPVSGGAFGAPASGGAGLFEGTPPSSGGGGLFGATPAAGGGGLFGSAAPKAQPAGRGLFGATQPATQNGGLFGGAPAQGFGGFGAQAGGGLFGQPFPTNRLRLLSVRLSYESKTKTVVCQESHTVSQLLHEFRPTVPSDTKLRITTTDGMELSQGIPLAILVAGPTNQPLDLRIEQMDDW
jgi:RNA recognition motif-containing protein